MEHSYLFYCLIPFIKCHHQNLFLIICDHNVQGENSYLVLVPYFFNNRSINKFQNKLNMETSYYENSIILLSREWPGSPKKSST